VGLFGGQPEHAQQAGRKLVGDLGGVHLRPGVEELKHAEEYAARRGEGDIGIVDVEAAGLGGGAQVA
jgi:hypothetical protein